MAVTELVKDGKLDLEAANKALDEYANNESPQEESADDDTVTVEDSGEAKAGEAAGDDWVSSLTDDMRELVDSLGLSSDELGEFTGPEELQRHANLIDKQILRMGDRLRPGQEQEAVLKAQDEAEEAQEKTTKQARDEHGRFTSEYKTDITEDEYDEAIVKEFRKIAGHFEGRLKSLEGMLQQSEQRAREAEQQQYDTLIDSLGHEDLFGSSERARTSEQRNNRTKLLQTLDVLRAGYAAMGRDVAVTPTLVKRALNQEFSEKLTEKQRRDFTRKVQEQSKRKLVGAGQRASTNENARWKGDPIKDPVLLEAYESIMREAGGR